MKLNKISRILRSSIILYRMNFKKNFYLTISVGVSLFLFLFVALYLDFGYANNVKSASKVQDNYIYVNLNQDMYSDFASKFQNTNHFFVTHDDATSYLYDQNGKRIKIHFNVILSDFFPDGLFIKSDLDCFGDSDLANSYDFEKYELTNGNAEFLSSNEVIISEELAQIIKGSPKDVVGMQIGIGIQGPDSVFKVTGTYSPLLTETRLNRPVFTQLAGNNEDAESSYDEEDDEELVYTVFMPSSAYPNQRRTSYDLYIFFEQQEEYQQLLDVLAKLDANERNNEKYWYLTPDSISSDLDGVYRSMTFTKSVLMVVVAVISGISVFGTMVNSINDRKKEIGIKKAVGASDRDIMLGFMFENVLNSIIAMIMAVVLASIVFIIYIYYERQIMLLDYSIAFYFETIILFICYAFSVIFGFSLLPAYRATQINIIDSLRDEQ